MVHVSIPLYTYSCHFLRSILLCILPATGVVSYCYHFSCSLASFLSLNATVFSSYPELLVSGLSRLRLILCTSYRCFSSRNGLCQTRVMSKDLGSRLSTSRISFGATRGLSPLRKPRVLELNMSPWVTSCYDGYPNTPYTTL
ncbi:hypothetical protein F4777DRAFT_562906 [Nemania sp. FL0916]|nr:hypothetical protein F4777DRAFT_562906 [Nemania sp. FL0916]